MRDSYSLFDLGIAGAFCSRKLLGRMRVWTAGLVFSVFRWDECLDVWGL